MATSTLTEIQMSIIPLAQNRDQAKVTREDRFKQATADYPYLFQFEYMKQGYYHFSHIDELWDGHHYLTYRDRTKVWVVISTLKEIRMNIIPFLSALEI